MNEATPIVIDRITIWSRRVLFASAAYVLACIPAIYIAESLHWPQWPFHMTQLFMCVVCAASAATFWFRTRHSPPTFVRDFSLVAMILAAAWLLLVIFVIVLLALLNAQGDLTD